MNDKSVLLHEFFLLALNLAQMKRQERVVELFRQAWNAHDLPLELAYSNEPVAGEVCEPIATNKNTFGFFILRKEPDQSIIELMPLARNLIKLLAVILENLQREKMLKKERGELEKTVEARVSEIKQGEQALRESEEKFRALYENAPLPFQSLDEEGCFLDVNPTWLRILGYDRDEVIGNCYADFLHPDWKPHFEKNFPAFKARGYVSDVQFKIRHKDGRYRDISFEGCIGYHPDGSFRQTYCVFQDITERKMAQEQLASSEERLRMALHAANQGLYDLNVQTGECTVSSEYAIMLGYDPDTFVESMEAWLARIHPDDLERTAGFYQDYIDGKVDEYRVEFRLRTAEGDWLWMLSCGRIVEYDAESQPLRMLGTHTNIDQRKKAEELLIASEERFRLLTDAITSVVWVTDAEGRFVEPQTEWEAYTGQSWEQYRDWGWAKSVDPADRDRVSALWQESVAQVKLHEASGRIWCAAANDYHHFVARAIPRKNADGSVIEWIGTVMDVHIQKTAEEELRHHHDNLEQRVEERTDELRKTVNLMAGREVRMAELKGVIASLQSQLHEAGLKPRGNDATPNREGSA